MSLAQAIFITVLTVISVAWIYAFKISVYGKIEAHCLDTIEKWARPPETIEGVFMYYELINGSVSSKRDVPVVFYSTKDFKEKKNAIYGMPTTETPHEDLVPDLVKSRFSNWELDYSFDEVKREPVEFVYNDTGELWEDKMGLDFFKEDWYEDFSEIRDRIYSNKSSVESELDTFWKESEGYSRFKATRNYAFVSNACINVRNGQVTLYMKSEMQISQLLSDFKWKDFYFNPYKLVKQTIPHKQFPSTPLNLLVAHPRSVHNAYQFLEGTSFLASIALHPEKFPIFKQLLVVANQREQIPNAWNRKALEIMLRMFPPTHRPTLLHPYSDPQFSKHNVLCDRVITFIRNWEPIGSGSFLGTELAADFFRASAYVYVHYFPPASRNDKLKLTLVRRPSIRLIENHDKFVQKINQKLLDYYVYDDIIFEELTIDERIKQMISTDVLFAVHGTGVANMLFMTRNSYFIEAYPPHWYWSCYQRFARSIGVKGVVFKSRGERGPECKDAEDKSTLCQQKGIRDRNFNMSVNDGIKYLWDARLYVIEFKYHRDPVTIERN